MVVETYLATNCLIILLITLADNCSVKPTVCRVKLNNRWFNVSMLCNPDDPFQVAKTVTSWNEGPLLFKTACNRDEDVPSVHCNYKNFSCTSIIDEFKDELVHQLNNKVSPQAVMERTFEKEALRLELHRLQKILQMFEGETTIYLSAYRDFDLISSSLDNYFFNIDNGIGLNSTLHHVYTKSDTETLYFVMFCPVQCIVDVLNQAFLVQTETVFRWTHWFVIPTEGSTAADFLHYDTNIPAGDIVIVDLFIGTTESNSTNIYKLEAPGEVRRVGCVDKKGNISLSEQLFSKTRNILSGKTLTVATLEWPPFVIKRIDNGTVTYEGMCMDLFNELSRVLHFSYRLVEPEDGSFGSAENGSWSGLVGLLANKRVDFAVSPLSITQEREAVMDFTVPYFHLPSGIIMKMSNSNSNKWMTLIAPFRSEVHICILFSLVLSTVLLFVVEEVNPGNVWTDKIWFARGTRFGDILWNHFGALTANGGSYLPTTVSGRTILCCWWLFTVISAATYSGNLIAFLTDWREKLPFTSLAEMVRQDTYKWGTLGGSVYIGLFHVDFDLISSSLDNYFFNIDNGIGLNSTLHHVYTKSDTETLYFVMFCPVQCIVDVLNQAFLVQTETVFRWTHWFVIPTEGSTAADFLHYDTNIPAGDIVIVDLFIGTTESNSTNIYKLEAPGEVRRVGCVDKKGNISLSEQLFSKTRNILSGKTLTVATLEWPPFVIKRIDNGTVTYEGMCMDLFNELSRVLHFSYRLVEPEDGSFGSAENGSWSGLVGLLANRRVDFAVSPLSITQEREAVMDFTVPYFHLPSGIIMKMSNSNSNKWMTLIAPFRSEVHICILLSLVLSTVFLFVVEEVNPGNVWTDKIWFARGTRFGDILWNLFGALTANGGSYLPTTVSGRTILCCWWLFTVISAATYSGNLIAFLTDWREKLPFTSLAEMVRQDTYKWGTLGGSVYIGLFHNSSDADYQRLWEAMQNNPSSLSLDMEQHRKLVDTEYYAFLGDIDTANSWQSEDCSIQFILDNYLTSYFSFGLQNNSIFNALISEETKYEILHQRIFQTSYSNRQWLIFRQFREYIIDVQTKPKVHHPCTNLRMLRINEMGLPDKWYKKWKPRVECETDKSSKRVDLLGLQSIFYAAGIGIVLSSIILFLELVFKKFTKINL